jgi:hypothetical protein
VGARRSASAAAKTLKGLYLVIELAQEDAESAQDA